MKSHVAIIGAGPAGLTAAYLLAKQNIAVTVLEADSEYVGGIARTVVYKNYCFDIGGHRFFSKSQEVEDFWTEILGDDMLIRPRSSRIFYNKKFFSYPLNGMEVLRKLGIIESGLCVLSYLIAKVSPVKQPKTFADWVTNHFGKRLFNIFFKTYTEKVWGMSCQEISADWAAQRIKGLSMASAIKNALLPKRKTNNIIKSLIESFRYPRKGPGMLWEVCADKIKTMGGHVKLDCKINHLQFYRAENNWLLKYESAGQIQTLKADHVISSAALHDLVGDYLTDAPTNSKAAATQLKYRDFLIVVLILKEKNHLTDNWIYIHDPTVDVARIQNFKSWSPEMVPDSNTCCYGMEYFCFENDGMWAMKDADLLNKATNELIQIGLACKEDILDGCVVRQAKAYPVYDEYYKEHVAVIRQELTKNFPNLHLVGRNGMHKYNNQDHAMMTAMLTVKNILAGQSTFDVWNVNQDAEYHEEETASAANFGLRSVPEKV